MVGWMIGAIVAAFAFALLGFTGIARGFAAIAKVLFYIFIVLAIIFFIAGR
jgi:uncharacterized membrane protein YtjA (UPF0391 family)